METTQTTTPKTDKAAEKNIAGTENSSAQSYSPPIDGQSKTRKLSRTMEAALRLKGSLIVNDPAFLL